MDVQKALARAVQVAQESPCQKSQRGVVIWCAHQTRILASGFNAPAEPLSCTGTEACRAVCNRICVHAEAAALLGLISTSVVSPLEMLHVKVVEGKAVASGPPSCWQCSRLIVAAGIAGMWLLHEGGLRRYTAQEFHEETLSNTLWAEQERGERAQARLEGVLSPEDVEA